MAKKSKHHAHQSSNGVQPSTINGRQMLPPPHMPSIIARHHSQPGSMNVAYSDTMSTRLSLGNNTLNHNGTNGGHTVGDLQTSTDTLRSSVVGSYDGPLTDDRSHLTSAVIVDQHRRQQREMLQHEIKFTKTESCTPGSCVCLMVAILLILVGATSGLYYGRKCVTYVVKCPVFRFRFVYSVESILVDEYLLSISLVKSW